MSDATREKKCCVLKLIKKSHSTNLCVSQYRGREKEDRNYEKKILDTLVV